MDKRDTKGRVLWKGESQNRTGANKGLYTYNYKDELGRRKVLRSWKLVETDLVPNGRRAGKALRTLEAELKYVKDTPKCSSGPCETLDSLFYRRMSLNTPVPKASTKEHYKSQYRIYIKDAIGYYPVDSITRTHIENFIGNLYEKGLSDATVERLVRIISATLNYAISLKFINENVCKGIMVKQQEGRKVHALTLTQQQNLKDYVSNNSRYCFWKDFIIFLLGTGLRVSEAAGLTWDCVDFENNIIFVNQALVVYNNESGKEMMAINSPKSRKGKRKVPMTREISEMLTERYLAYVSQPKSKSVCFGNESGFVFCNKKNNVINRNNFASVMRRIRQSYNKEEIIKAKKEKRNPILMPECGAHVLRHTFTTRLCESSSQLNVIQSICGHEDIKTTLDIYAEVHDEVIQEVISGLNALSVYEC